MTGYIHSMESMGLVDGPGVRTVVFLQGCPLRCRYCHNPDTQCGGGRPVEDGTLVMRVATQQALIEKTVATWSTVKSRGAYLMGLTSFGSYAIEDTVDFAVYVPKTEPCFAASLAVVPLQLMGYYVSVAKGLDVDKPRNLAKSVTVE